MERRPVAAVVQRQHLVLHPARNDDVMRRTDQRTRNDVKQRLRKLVARGQVTKVKVIHTAKLGKWQKSYLLMKACQPNSAGRLSRRRSYHPAKNLTRNANSALMNVHVVKVVDWTPIVTVVHTGPDLLLHQHTLALQLVPVPQQVPVLAPDPQLVPTLQLVLAPVQILQLFLNLILAPLVPQLVPTLQLVPTPQLVPVLAPVRLDLQLVPRVLLKMVTPDHHKCHSDLHNAACYAYSDNVSCWAEMDIALLFQTAKFIVLRIFLIVASETYDTHNSHIMSHITPNGIFVGFVFNKFHMFRCCSKGRFKNVELRYVYSAALCPA
jgi:hypothetical protein